MVKEGQRESAAVRGRRDFPLAWTVSKLRSQSARYFLCFSLSLLLDLLSLSLCLSPASLCFTAYIFDIPFQPCRFVVVRALRLVVRHF